MGAFYTRLHQNASSQRDEGKGLSSIRLGIKCREPDGLGLGLPDLVSKDARRIETMIRRLMISCALVAALGLAGLAQGDWEAAAGGEGKMGPAVKGVGNWAHSVAAKESQAQAF